MESVKITSKLRESNLHQWFSEQNKLAHTLKVIYIFIMWWFEPYRYKALFFFAELQFDKTIEKSLTTESFDLFNVIKLRVYFCIMAVFFLFKYFLFLFMLRITYNTCFVFRFYENTEKLFYNIGAKSQFHICNIYPMKRSMSSTLL